MDEKPATGKSETLLSLLVTPVHQKWVHQYRGNQNNYPNSLRYLGKLITFDIHIRIHRKTSFFQGPKGVLEFSHVLEFFHFLMSIF